MGSSTQPSIANTSLPSPSIIMTSSEVIGDGDDAGEDNGCAWAMTAVPTTDHSADGVTVVSYSGSAVVDVCGGGGCGRVRLTGPGKADRDAIDCGDMDGARDGDRIGEEAAVVVTVDDVAAAS
jgi:hypothetical protein